MTAIGIRNQTADGSPTFAKNFDGDAADAAASAPIANLKILPGEVWQTTDATAANTRFHVALDRPRPIGALQLRGSNASAAALAREVRGLGWVERWGVEMQSAAPRIDSGLLIPTAADRTVMLWYRSAVDLKTVDLFTNVAWFGTSPAAGVTLDWSLEVVGTSGILRLRVFRYLAGFTTLSSLARIDDGQWHQIVFTLNDSTTTAEFWIDGVSQASDTITAHSSQTNQKIQCNNHGKPCAFGPFMVWDRVLSDAEIGTLWTGADASAESKSLILRWLMDEGTMTALEDTANAGTPTDYDGTISGTTAWIKWVRPSGSAVSHSGIVDVRGPWKSRKYLALDAADYARTAASLSNSVSMSLAWWMRVPVDVDDAGSNSAYVSFGNGASSATREFQVFSTGGDGILRPIVSRYGSAASIALATGADGLWHRHLIVLDGAADQAHYYIDGTEDASSPWAIDPYTAKSAERLSLGANVAATETARADFAGDIVRWNRVVTPAEDNQYGRLAPELDAGMVSHYTLEDETTPIVCRGAASVDLDLTGGTWGTLDADDLPSDTTERRPGLAAEDPKEIIFEDSANTTADKILVEIVDPDNSDAYFEASYLGLWDLLIPEDGRAYGGLPAYSAPGFSTTAGGLLYPSEDRQARAAPINLQHLTRAEAMSLHHHLDRRREDMAPVLFLLGENRLGTDAQVWLVDQAVLGICLRADLQELRTASPFWSLTAVLTEIPA